MSARAITVWFIDTDDPVGYLKSHPVNDVDGARELAAGIYGERVLVPEFDTDLASAAEADDSHVYAGWYGYLGVVVCSLFATQTPSTLTRSLTAIHQSAVTTLLVTDPETSFGAFARWENGTLKRSFAAYPVDITEDEGLPYPFERPFWAGEYPLRYAPGVTPELMALPFHPQHLAEQANREWLGFRFTRPLADTDHDPTRIPVTAFSIHPADYVPGEEDRERYRASGQPAPVAEEPAVTSEPPVKRRSIARYFGF